MEAIRRACEILETRDLSNCVLYTSAEPCFMCSYAICACRIGTVVFRARNEDVGGFTSAFPILTITTVENWGPAPEIIQGALP
jgi:tRNA(adenine34) deaminase